MLPAQNQRLAIQQNQSSGPKIAKVSLFATLTGSHVVSGQKADKDRVVTESLTLFWNRLSKKVAAKTHGAFACFAYRSRVHLGLSAAAIKSADLIVPSLEKPEAAAAALPVTYIHAPPPVR